MYLSICSYSILSTSTESKGEVPSGFLVQQSLSNVSIYDAFLLLNNTRTRTLCVHFMQSEHGVFILFLCLNDPVFELIKVSE